MLVVLNDNGGVKEQRVFLFRPQKQWSNNEFYTEIDDRKSIRKVEFNRVITTLESMLTYRRIVKENTTHEIHGVVFDV